MTRHQAPHVTDETEFVEVDLDSAVVRLPDGSRLTEAKARELATDGVRTARLANLIPGGKSLGGDGRHSPVVQVRVPEELKSRLSALAAADGVSVSKLSRRAIEEYVAARS